MKPTLYALYRAPVSVWVEDPLTYSVLTDVWHDPEINVVITQGKPGVVHMVRSNPNPDRYCVLGIVDRDFEDDNEARWRDAACRVLRLPVHEFENLLLDFDVLAGLAKGSSAAEIRARGRARAVELCWWMVYKAVLRRMQQELGAGFPADVPEDGALLSAASVEANLRASPSGRTTLRPSRAGIGRPRSTTRSRIAGVASRRTSQGTTGREIVLRQGNLPAPSIARAGARRGAEAASEPDQRGP